MCVCDFMLSQTTMVNLFERIGFVGKIFGFAMSVFIAGCYSSQHRENYQPTRDEAWDTPRPAQSFHTNTGKEWVKFGVNAADCVDRSGRRGVFAIKFNGDSILQRKGMMPGDQFLQVHGITPKTTGELTYIIQRITPGTSTTIVFHRNGKRYEITVAPPSWVPNSSEVARVTSKYRISPCPTIGMSPA